MGKDQEENTNMTTKPSNNNTQAEPMALVEKLKAYRKRHNLSQHELATMLKTSWRMIYRYENGQAIPSNATLLQITALLDADPTTDDAIPDDIPESVKAGTSSSAPSAGILPAATSPVQPGIRQSALSQPISKDDIDVGERIRAYRSENNLSLKELSHTIGISIQSLHRYESGKSSPSQSNFQKIISLLEIDSDDEEPDLLSGSANISSADSISDTASSDMASETAPVNIRRADLVRNRSFQPIQNQGPASAEPSTQGGFHEYLSKPELELIKLFRNMSIEDQQGFLWLIKRILH